MPKTGSLLAIRRLVDAYDEGKVEFDYEVERALTLLWTAFETGAECPECIEVDWWEAKKLEYFGPASDKIIGEEHGREDV